MISKSEALKVARLIFPKTKGVKKINKGFSHNIFEIKTGEFPKKVILKVCIQERENHFSLKKEARIHEMLKGIGIPVPEVIKVDDSKEIISAEFMICEYVPGTDLDKIWNKISKKEQEEIATKMGEILGKIHEIKFDKYGYLKTNGIKDEYNWILKGKGKKVKLNPSSLAILSWTLNDFGRLFVNKSFSNEKLNKIFNYLHKNQKLSECYEKPSLVHGDFDILNIKVKKIKGNWEICSLLDFEYSASLPKEYDFIKLHRRGFFEKEYLKKSLLKGYKKYQKISKDFESKIKFMRITRDIAFAGVLFNSGSVELGNKVINYVLKESSK